MASAIFSEALKALKALNLGDRNIPRASVTYNHTDSSQRSQRETFTHTSGILGKALSQERDRYTMAQLMSKGQRTQYGITHLNHCQRPMLPVHLARPWRERCSLAAHRITNGSQPRRWQLQRCSTDDGSSAEFLGSLTPVSLFPWRGPRTSVDRFSMAQLRISKSKNQNI